MRHIIKICQASVVFTVFDDLFHRWLEQAHILNTLDEVSRAVQAMLGAKALLGFYGVIEDNRREGSHNRFSVVNISCESPRREPNDRTCMFTSANRVDAYKLERWAATEYMGEGGSKREAQQAAAERLLRGEKYCVSCRIFC